MSARGLLPVLSGLLIGPHAVAACVLPVPDGGAREPSKPNLVGRVVKVESSAIHVQDHSSGALVHVHTVPATTFTKQHGGWLPREGVKPGQQVWVWFKDCRRATAGTSEAAYVRLVTDSVAN